MSNVIEVYLDAEPGNAVVVTPDDLARAATSVEQFVITVTVADTEYSQALPANTRILTFRARNLTDIRYAYATGKVAASVEPYFHLYAGEIFNADDLNLTGVTLYVSSSVASTEIEIEAWS